jgi:hypothetical protein
MHCCAAAKYLKQQILQPVECMQRDASLSYA